MKLGIIADDYTGGTDAASFVVQAGLRCIQVNGVPNQDITDSLPDDVDVLVVSLKTRSEPTHEAITHSLAAYYWLKEQGCTQFQFKYCSTFDSTQQGNIGPVVDALMDEMNLETTTLCPALPINGRQVIYGNLYVHGVSLNESGMRNHPLTPMRDANILRLMEAQSIGRAALIDFNTVEQGYDAVQEEYQRLKQQGYRYIVVDTLNQEHLAILGAAFTSHSLLTGGSGISGALAQFAATNDDRPNKSLLPPPNKTVVVSGSCSTQTNLQVEYYRALAPYQKLDLDEVINNPAYSQQLANWVEENSSGIYAPLVSATVSANELAMIRKHYPDDISLKIEKIFSLLVAELHRRGYCNFISAGGETSGSVTQALNVDALEIGATIAPGVPWVKVINNNTYLALKSGNFGAQDFFQHAQDLFLNKI